MVNDWKDRTDYHDCPCCGDELDGYIQSYPAKYHLADKVVVTCRNRDCDMWDLTHLPERHAELCGQSAKSA